MSFKSLILVQLFLFSICFAFPKILVTTGYNGGDLDNTEIVDVHGDCSTTLPNYPKRFRGTTGQYIQDEIIICGGGYYDECYSLKKGASSFENITLMKEARDYAKSIAVTQSQIWVTGGRGNRGKRLSSTEYIPKSLTNEPSLPEPVRSHALVSINETTSMLIGGSTNNDDISSKTHYFNHQNQSWKDGPRLINGRREHSAGVIIDHITQAQHIAVVGGYINGGSDSVEILFNGETQWNKGTL